MKLALLKGNRFNPWHLQAFRHLEGNPAITAFRAESEIQRHFHDRDDGSLPFAFERIYFDTQAGNPLLRAVRTVQARYGGRELQILPFYDRLRGFDLVQSWELFTEWSEQAVEARERYGVPLAVMVWDNIPFNMETRPGVRALKERVAKTADAFVVHTERSRRMLDMEGVPSERVALVPPGVDTTVFTPGEGQRNDLGLDDDEFVILFVGWLLPRKGIDFLVLALRELLADAEVRVRRPRLVMVGSGPGRDRVERLVERVGVADASRFAGMVPYDRMPAMYRSADAFVLPSVAMPEWQEQFGMALIEAMACGTPVVASQSGAIPEIVGDAGVLAQPNDFVALYEALRRLILEPGERAALGAAARERVLERFALDASAAALSEVYGKLV